MQCCAFTLAALHTMSVPYHAMPCLLYASAQGGGGSPPSHAAPTVQFNNCTRTENVYLPVLVPAHPHSLIMTSNAWLVAY